MAMAGNATVTTATPVVFGLTLVSVNASNILDLNSKYKVLGYKQATTTLIIPFNGNSKYINLVQS